MKRYDTIEKYKQDSEEGYHRFIELFVHSFPSYRLQCFINNQNTGLLSTDNYWTSWEAKRYVECLYTVSNWYLNNINSGV